VVQPGGRAQGRSLPSSSPSAAKAGRWTNPRRARPLVGIPAQDYDELAATPRSRDPVTAPKFPRRAKEIVVLPPRLTHFAATMRRSGHGNGARVTVGAYAAPIKLVESTRADHARGREALLARSCPQAGVQCRVGILGCARSREGSRRPFEAPRVVTRRARPTGRGHAVRTVEHGQSCGSILGDKTRREQLTRSPLAFVRPSPTAATQAGRPAQRLRRCCW